MSVFLDAIFEWFVSLPEKPIQSALDKMGVDKSFGRFLVPFLVLILFMCCISACVLLVLALFE